MHDPYPDRDDVEPRASEEPGELQHEIERTREELGDTVEALAGKVDVKSRVKTKVAGARGHAADATPEDAKRVALQLANQAEARPLPAIGLALVVGFLAGRFSARR